MDYTLTNQNSSVTLNWLQYSEAIRLGIQQGWVPEDTEESYFEQIGQLVSKTDANAWGIALAEATLKMSNLHTLDDLYDTFVEFADFCCNGGFEIGSKMQDIQRIKIEQRENNTIIKESCAICGMEFTSSVYEWFLKGTLKGTWKQVCWRCVDEIYYLPEWKEMRL